VCAVKTIEIACLDQKQKREAALEATVLASLKHPYIVRYHESFIASGSLNIVMEFAEGGDLCQRICRAKDEEQTFSEQQILKWFTQASLGLKYLHANHILHRDVKSQNLFLTKQEDVRIGDFGIAKAIEHLSVTEEKVLGSPAYLSPEIYESGRYSFGSDVWALGCVLYELAALRVPFEAQNLPALIRRITKMPAPLLPQLYSAELRRIGGDLLCQEPGQRPSCADLLQRPLLRAEISRMLLCEQETLGPAASKVEAPLRPVMTAWAAPPPVGKSWSPQATLLSKPRERSPPENRRLLRSGSASILQGVGPKARADTAAHRSGVPPLPLASAAGGGGSSNRLEKSRSRRSSPSRHAPSSFMGTSCGRDRGLAGLPSRPGSSRVIMMH